MLKRPFGEISEDDDVNVSDAQEEEAVESDDEDLDVDQENADDDSDASDDIVPHEYYQSLEQSLVKIFITEFIADREFPWRDASPRLSHGTGTVIDAQKGYILTCSHVAKTTSVVRVRACNGIEDYPAEVLVSEADCDLALLRVTAPAFLSQVKAVQLGKMQPIGAAVMALGFPITGEELTATLGNVTSIQVDDYTEGDAYNIACLLDAPINRGNSGGPVFNEAQEQIGVVFQCWDPDYAERGGQFVPIPVIEQFLKSADESIRTGKPAQGVPALPIETKPVINSALRAHFQMKDHHSGVYVLSIDNLAANRLGGLQVNDVILSIDGVTIRDDATINAFPEISEHLDYRYLISRKQMGETLDMRVLRQGVEHQLKVPLAYRANELKLVGRKDETVQPSFYIKNGVCFQRGTFYLLTNEEITALGSTYDIEHGHFLLVPQNKPNEELVMLTRFLDTDVSEGYDKSLQCKTVHSVNGIEVNNLFHLIQIMETHTGPDFTIQLGNENKFALKRSTPQDEMKMLESNHISKAHSKDIAQFIATLQGNHASSSATASSTHTSFVQQGKQDKQVDVKTGQTNKPF